MACSLTASANNCCPWHAHCSPQRTASPCLCRPCLTATLALSPLRKGHARRPALHRRTTLFCSPRLFLTASANPRCRLAPRTSPLECVHSTQNSFMSTSHAIPERLDCRKRIELLTARPHHRRR